MSVSEYYCLACGFYAMKLWLQNFAYRTSIEFWTFLLAAGLAFIIVLQTIRFPTIRAVYSNPVDSLWYE